MDLLFSDVPYLDRIDGLLEEAVFHELIGVVDKEVLFPWVKSLVFAHNHKSPVLLIEGQAVAFCCTFGLVILVLQAVAGR